MSNKDFTILTTPGNVAFYNSCEVTQLFLHNKKDKTNSNFLTLAVFEEKLFDKTNHHFLGSRIVIGKEYSLSIQRYWLSIEDAKKAFNILENENNWNYFGDKSLNISQLRPLSKQYIPAQDDNGLNKILKNNFHSGSYIMEFFDEHKSHLDFLINIESLSKLEVLSEKIKKIIPIDLSIMRDRIGNVIFQFPIRILEANSSAMASWKEIEIYFSWHGSLLTPPDCLIQAESRIERSFMGAKIEDYNKTSNQVVDIGNLDQMVELKVWRKEPSLILFNFNGGYLREFALRFGIINPVPRIFELDGKVEIEQISSNDGIVKPDKADYRKFVLNKIYDEEKKQLEGTLSFKQYKFGMSNFGLNDLKQLIKSKDQNGVYLWDPFLSSTDILRTMYYSSTSGVPLRAIGSINKAVKTVYSGKGKSVSDIISEHKFILDNPNNNNQGLNLEFRMQHQGHGWAFHDRFLIFPGAKQGRPQVYSLGTSINSYGENHHILQEVSHPQPVIDAFNELWEELNKPECLVWKFPR